MIKRLALTPAQHSDRFFGCLTIDYEPIKHLLTKFPLIELHTFAASDDESTICCVKNQAVVSKALIACAFASASKIARTGILNPLIAMLSMESSIPTFFLSS